VKFYNYDLNENVKKLINEVAIEKIIDNCYSLNYAEYMNEEIQQTQY
jgi:hypothetical protein